MKRFGKGILISYISSGNDFPAGGLSAGNLRIKKMLYTGNYSYNLYEGCLPYNNINRTIGYNWFPLAFSYFCKKIVCLKSELLELDI